MKPTRLRFLLLIALPTALAGYFVATVLVGRGFQVPVSPINLLVTLAAIAVLLLALSIPIWRYRSAIRENVKKRPKRVDPFYAVRVLLLAKASSIAGSLFAGWHIGVVVFQLLSPVVIAELALQNFLGFLSSIALVIGAYLTEQLCKLPEDPMPDSNEPVTS
jgi:hypothetical protein